MEEEEEITAPDPPIKIPREVKDCIEEIRKILKLLGQSEGSDDAISKNLPVSDYIESFTNIEDAVSSSDFKLTASSAYTNLKKQLIATNESLRLFLSSPGEDHLGKFYQSYEVILELLPKIRGRRSRNSTTEEANLILNETQKIASEFVDLKEAAETELSDIGKLKFKGEELIQLLAGRALRDSYQIRADDEKKTAKNWTYLTLGFAVAAIISLVGTFVWQIYYLNENVINYQFLSTKVLFTITLGLAAKWTSKRANRHLMEESKYHRLAVNMATISAFIAPLGKEQQNTVLSAIALKIFANESGNEMPTDYETASALELFKVFFSKLEK